LEKVVIGNTVDEAIKQVAETTDDLKAKLEKIIADGGNDINAVKTEILKEMEKLVATDQSKNKENKTLKEVPKFNGNVGESLEDWLFVVENCALQEGIAKENTIGALMPHFRGNALQTIKRFVKENSVKDWDGLKKRLKEQFSSEDVRMKAL
jgi:hypothetical protein